MSDDELYPTPDDYDNYTMKESPTYTPPKVWQWNQDEENRFSKINRPIAGATHDKDLPVGEHPLQLYSLATPNGVKVTVMLEELLALGISGPSTTRGWLTSWRATSSPVVLWAPTPTPRSRRWLTTVRPHPPGCSNPRPS